MADRTAIQWTDVTWNPVTGCSKISPGCAHCYAEAWSRRRGWTRRSWTPINAGENVVLHRDRLEQPPSWRASRMVFVCSMGDLFHEQVPDEFIREVFDVMRCCDSGVSAATGRRRPRHVFQVLTKRPARMRELAVSRQLGFDPGAPPANVWLGTSIENRRFVDRADVLRETPAAVRFISAEPLLGPLMAGESVAVPCVEETVDPGEPMEWDVLPFWADRSEPGGPDELYLTGIDWLIIGGESGPRARRMDFQWARDLLAYGRQADKAVFVKQLGSRWARRVGARDRHGSDPEEWPKDLRVRQWPADPAALSGGPERTEAS